MDISRVPGLASVCLARAAGAESGGGGALKDPITGKGYAVTPLPDTTRPLIDLVCALGRATLEPENAREELMLALSEGESVRQLTVLLARHLSCRKITVLFTDAPSAVIPFLEICAKTPMYRKDVFPTVQRLAERMGVLSGETLGQIIEVALSTKAEASFIRQRVRHPSAKNIGVDPTFVSPAAT